MINDRFSDLYKIIQFCRDKDVWAEFQYSVSDDSLEIRIGSAAPLEEYYIKRVPSIDYFIEEYEKTIKERISQASSSK